MILDSKIYILIPIFNRLDSLRNLIDSINCQKFTNENFEIWFAIDFSDQQARIIQFLNQPDVLQFDFSLIVRDEKYGLKRNTIESINELFKITNSENLVLLEDDLILSPNCFSFISSIYENKFISKSDIFGVSLYAQNKELNHFTQIQFSNLQSYYKLALPSSWGSVINFLKWEGFVDSLDENLNFKLRSKDIVLPKWINSWNNETSWKKQLTIYCLHNTLFYIYPKVSYTAHIGYNGTHFNNQNNSNLNGSIFSGNYDSSREDIDFVESFDIFFEPKANIFKKIFSSDILDNLEVDLFGNKPINNKKKYWLTCKKSRNNISTFGFEIQKPSDNILNNIKGDFFKLCLSIDLLESDMTIQKNHFFNSNYNPTNLRFLLKYCLISLKNRFLS